MDFDQLSKEYRGATAVDYLSRREQTPKWSKEHAAVERILAMLPRKLRVLDIPVGTGRFLGLYRANEHSVTGMDVSGDMLRISLGKANELAFSVSLRLGDIRKIDAPDNAFDVAVCVRFLNWVELAGVNAVMTELSRVTTQHLIVSISHYMPLSEIEVWTVSGLRMLFNQGIRRAKSRVSTLMTRKHGIIWHEKASLLKVFADHSLSVREAICTEAGAGRGLAAYVYLLRKQVPAVSLAG